jgi:hypothetical protein
MANLPKFSRWFIFTVLISLIPIGYAILKMLTFSKPFKLESVIGRGELLLISTAIGGGAIGEVIGTTKTHPVLKIIAAGGCILTVLMSAMWFADILSAVEGQVSTLSGSIISYGSLIILGITIFAAAFCIILSER